MECKEFDKLIPLFLDHKLDYKTMDQFKRHKSQCESCNEELTIRFLVTKGIQRLEEGDAFDLQKELEHYMEEAERKLRFDQYLPIIFGMLGALFALLLVGTIVWFLL